MLLDAVAVVNTCSMMKNAPDRYAQRVDWVRENVRILKEQGFGQVIVAGEFEKGKDYDYVPVEQMHRNCRDVLRQRYYGNLAVKGDPDFVWFQMDDHALVHRPPALTLHHVDVLSPIRVGGVSGKELNSGWNRVGFQESFQYLHTHALLLSRKCRQSFSWDTITPVYRFDVVCTWLWQETGMAIQCNREWVIKDLEE